MSVARQVFDRDYLEKRRQLVRGEVTLSEFRDWILVRGQQTALAEELERKFEIKEQAVRRADRDLKSLEGVGEDE